MSETVKRGERLRKKRAARRQRRAERARRHATEKIPAALPVRHHTAAGKVSAATFAARLAEMPTHDARDLTGRILGDPNPADARRRP